MAMRADEIEAMIVAAIPERASKFATSPATAIIMRRA
jgi:hypothetical protein